MNSRNKAVSIITAITIMASLSGCAATADKSEPKFYSEKGITKALSKVITEDFEVVQCIDDGASKHIWECSLPDRDNLKFKVYDTIENTEAGTDGLKVQSNWYNKISTDYGVVIKNNSESVVKAYAEKYGLKLDDSNAKEYHLYTIKVESKDKLDDLVNFYVDVDNLYEYNCKDAEIGKTDIVDYIVFEKEGVTIESVKWSNKKKERFTKNSVKDIIVKRFNSKASAEDVITGAGTSSSDSILPDIDVDDIIPDVDDIVPDVDDIIPSKDDAKSKVSEVLPDNIIPETTTTTTTTTPVTEAPETTTTTTTTASSQEESSESKAPSLDDLI